MSRGGGWGGGEVARHLAVDDVGEVAFEDAAGFFFGVTAGAGVGVEGLRAGVASELGDGHAVQDGVHAAVAAGGEAVAGGVAGALAGAGGGWRRCRQTGGGRLWGGAAG